MKKTFLFCLLLTVITSLNAQSAAADSVYTDAEKKPEFKNGLTGWTSFLEQNLDRGLMEKNNAPSGKYTTVASFLVHPDGSVSDIKIEKDPGYGAAAETRRMLQLSSKKWLPAYNKGVAVTYLNRQSLTLVRN